MPAPHAKAMSFRWLTGMPIGLGGERVLPQRLPCPAGARLVDEK